MAVVVALRVCLLSQVSQVPVSTNIKYEPIFLSNVNFIAESWGSRVSLQTDTATSFRPIDGEKIWQLRVGIK